MPHSGHDVYARFVEEIRLHKNPSLGGLRQIGQEWLLSEPRHSQSLHLRRQWFCHFWGANPTEDDLAIAARTADYVVSQRAIFRHRASRICIFFHISTNRFYVKSQKAFYPCFDSFSEQWDKWEMRSFGWRKIPWSGKILHHECST